MPDSPPGKLSFRRPGASLSRTEIDRHAHVTGPSPSSLSASSPFPPPPPPPPPPCQQHHHHRHGQERALSPTSRRPIPHKLKAINPKPYINLSPHGSLLNAMANMSRMGSRWRPQSPGPRCKSRPHPAQKALGGLGFGDLGLGLGFRVWGSWFRIFGDQGLRIWVWGEALGFRDQECYQISLSACHRDTTRLLYSCHRVTVMVR